MSADVAVYGATGYTGSRIARALLDVGMEVVLAGRSPSRLEQAAIALGGRADTHVADRDDSAALEALSRRARVVVDAAPSYEDPGFPLADAAIRAGRHYLNISNSQRTVARFISEYGRRADAAGIGLVPVAGFISSIAEAAVALVAEDFVPLDVEIAYAIDGWNPSGMNLENWLYGVQGEIPQYRNGIHRLDRMPPTRLIDFGPNAGRRRGFVFPGPEVHTIPLRQPVDTLDVWMTTATLSPAPLGRLLPMLSRATAFGLRHRATAALAGGLFTRISGGDHHRHTGDPTTFTVAVRVRNGDSTRRVLIEGAHMYDITAPILTRAITRLLDPGFDRTGVLTMPDLVDPRTFLESLASQGVTWSITPTAVLA